MKKTFVLLSVLALVSACANIDSSRHAAEKKEAEAQKAAQKAAQEEAQRKAAEQTQLAQDEDCDCDESLPERVTEDQNTESVTPVAKQETAQPSSEMNENETATHPPLLEGQPHHSDSLPAETPEEVAPIEANQPEETPLEEVPAVDGIPLYTCRSANEKEFEEAAKMDEQIRALQMMLTLNSDATATITELSEDSFHCSLKVGGQERSEACQFKEIPAGQQTPQGITIKNSDISSFDFEPGIGISVLTHPLSLDGKEFLGAVLKLENEAAPQGMICEAQ